MLQAYILVAPRNAAEYAKVCSGKLHFLPRKIVSLSGKSFCPQKRTTARYSLGDDFNGNVTIFNVYKWRHSDVIIIKFTCDTQLNSLQNIYFGFFNIWKTNRMMLFCNLFIERPSYLSKLVIFTADITGWATFHSASHKDLTFLGQSSFLATVPSRLLTHMPEIYYLLN